MSKTTEIVATETSIQPFFERALANVREDVADNPYIIEALKVLTVGGYSRPLKNYRA